MDQGDFIFDIRTLRQFMKTALGPANQRGRFRDEDCDACLMQAIGMALRNASHEQLSEYLLSCCSAMGVEADAEIMDGAALRIMEETRKARSPT